MTHCFSCDEEPAYVEWRGERWCTDCFETEATARDCREGWVNRVLGTVSSGRFEPPVDAASVDYESRVEMLADYTVLDRREAAVQVLGEHGLSPEEIAQRLDTDVETVESTAERVDDLIERARTTLKILD